MRKNNYTSFFKIKPKKVEKYIRCKKMRREYGMG